MEDIIIHKVFAGRSRDLEDVKSLILKNFNFDEDYVIKWLKEFDYSTGGKKFLSSFNSILREIRRKMRKSGNWANLNK